MLRYTIVIIALLTNIYAQSGMVGKHAPLWKVDSWVQNPSKNPNLDVSDFRGKVIYVYAFQSWCPGCHSHGFPVLKELIKHYEKNKDVKFVAIQSTFEGFSTNNEAAALKTAQKYKLKIPIGQSGSKKKLSSFMLAYQTRGTPWSVIIDKKGIIKYNSFGIEEGDAIKLINDLLK